MTFSDEIKYFVLYVNLYLFWWLNLVMKFRLCEKFANEIFYWRKYPDLRYIPVPYDCMIDRVIITLIICSWMGMLLGIVVGHLYFFITMKYPQEFGGRQLIHTPQFM